ncbi:hypothetical protein [Streptomyces violascens]|uniref:hypothetical protein n=1 Tax=Streptomyces violascens TaxID=67381 RepID=UPI0036B360F2
MPKTQPWFETLADSAYALGAAACEAQRAARTAELARDAYSLDRLRPVDGYVRLDGRDASMPFRPHDAVLFTVGDVLSEQANKLRALYNQAATGYAYGTAWAILRVLDGDHPDAVALGRTQEGYYVIPGELCPVPPLMPALQGWNDYPKFVAAHARMAICEEAGLFAEYLDEQDPLSEQDAAAFHEALDTASGTADAAVEFGHLAQSALHFALLKPRAEHHR